MNTIPRWATSKGSWAGRILALLACSTAISAAKDKPRLKISFESDEGYVVGSSLSSPWVVENLSTQISAGIATHGDQALLAKGAGTARISLPFNVYGGHRRVSFNLRPVLHADFTAATLVSVAGSFLSYRREGSYAQIYALSLRTDGTPEWLPVPIYLGMASDAKSRAWSRITLDFDFQRDSWWVVTPSGVRSKRFFLAKTRKAEFVLYPGMDAPATLDELVVEK